MFSSNSIRHLLFDTCATCLFALCPWLLFYSTMYQPPDELWTLFKLHTQSLDKPTKSVYIKGPSPRVWLLWLHCLNYTVNLNIFLNLHIIHKADNITSISININVGSIISRGIITRNLEANNAFLQYCLSLMTILRACNSTLHCLLYFFWNYIEVLAYQRSDFCH